MLENISIICSSSICSSVVNQFQTGREYLRCVVGHRCNFHLTAGNSQILSTFSGAFCPPFIWIPCSRWLVHAWYRYGNCITVADAPLQQNQRQRQAQEFTSVCKAATLHCTEHGELRPAVQMLSFSFQFAPMWMAADTCPSVVAG